VAEADTPNPGEFKEKCLLARASGGVYGPVAETGASSGEGLDEGEGNVERRLCENRRVIRLLSSLPKSFGVRVDLRESKSESSHWCMLSPFRERRIGR